MKKIIPLHDYVLIKPDDRDAEKEIKTKSGITYVADRVNISHGDVLIGEIVGVGDMLSIDNPQRRKFLLKILRPGTKVYYKKDIPVKAGDYSIMGHGDCLAIVEDEVQ